MMQDKTDPELVALAKDGVEDAWRELRDRHYPAMIEWRGRAIKRGIDEVEAESTTELALVMSVKNFNPDLGVKFFTYFYNALRTHSYSCNYPGLFHIPKAAFSKETTRPYAEQALKCCSLEWSVEVEQPSPTDDLLRDDEILKVRRCLKHLSKRDADIVMSHIDGETYRSLGERHGISKQRVEQVFKKSLTALKEHLKAA